MFTMTSKTETITKYVVCRYCLKDSKHYNEIYFISDEKEVYENMVKDTFNIQICSLKPFDKMLCTKCAEDFRLAATVKQKVLDVQKSLLEQSEKLPVLGLESPKQDSSGFDDYEYNESAEDDIDTQWEKDFDDTNLKTDDDEEHKEKDVDHLASKSHVDNSKIIKLEPMELNEIVSKTRKKSGRKGANKVPKMKKSYLVSKRVKEVTTKANSSKTDTEKPKTDQSEAKMIFDGLRHIRNNTLKLITNSNVCLFKSKRTKYACYFCRETYLDFRDLREHSISHKQNHLNEQIKRCRGMTYKNVDISNLTCKVCSNPCHDLKGLREHLTNIHGITFGDGEHLLLPFRLEEGFNCVICQEAFRTFTRLSIHMNSHSTSNVCEKCGVAYTNRQSLRNHINAVHKEKHCSKCSAVFPNHSTRVRHMRIAHNVGDYKRYCTKCEMTFRYAYNLVEHMIEKHGAKRQMSDCEHCGKRFSSSNNLKIHVRSVHIGERNYPCSICDRRFFTTFDKNRHERTHGGEKTFSCSFCEVKFRSKDSMRRHLRKQHGSSKMSS